MAKVLLGANVVSITGKLGGTVFQGSKYGTIMRRKVSPNRHGHKGFNNNFGFVADYFQDKKAFMRLISHSWQQLTESNRQSWLKAEWGGLTGFALYMRYNAATFNGVVLIGSYPGPPRQPPFIKFIAAKEQSGNTGKVEISYVLTDSSPLWLFMIYISSPVSRGNYGSGQGWRYHSPTQLILGSNSIEVDPSFIGLPTNFHYNLAYRMQDRVSGFIYPIVPIQRNVT